MFNKGQISLSTEYILSLVRDVDLLNYYFNISCLPCLIHSPIREDKNPSFSIFIDYNNRVVFHDFATKDGGDIFTLLSLYWKCSRQETFKRVYWDLSNIQITNFININKTSTNTNIKKSKYELNVKIRKLKKYDIEFWESFGINEKWLNFGLIYPISHIFLHNDQVDYLFSADKYAYVYIEYKDNIPTFKIYQPYSNKTKWLNNHDKSVWDLWNKLPVEGDNLIITSSRKDALCIWANCNIPSTSLQAESYLPKQQVVKQLKERFKNIYVLYDNDFNKPINYGKEYGKQFSSKFELNQIIIPDIYQVKDPSDLFKQYGKEIFKQVIFSLL